MIDSFRHKGLRHQLVQVIQSKGITNDKVLDAVERVPRHFFFDSIFINQAYEDNAFPIGSGQTISQPFTVAFQTQLLNITPGLKVLEIGTGSGYQAAILAAMSARVYTIERHKELYRNAQQTISKMGYKNIQFFYGDGFQGKEAYAPFDRIIITCGAPSIPEKLISQLAPNGIMIVPVDEGVAQVMYKITFDTNGDLKKEKFGDFSFVPMLKGIE